VDRETTQQVLMLVGGKREDKKKKKTNTEVLVVEGWYRGVVFCFLGGFMTKKTHRRQKGMEKKGKKEKKKTGRRKRGSKLPLVVNHFSGQGSRGVEG